MRIISWNVNGLRALEKKGQFEWLINTGGDIIVLQETKAEASQLPDKLLNPQGYFSFFDHSKVKKGYSGVAAFTKVKPEIVRFGIDEPRLDNEGRFLGLKFKDFWLFNVYFPNGGGGPERLKFKLDYYDHFLVYINKLKKTGEKIIFCGDINTAHEEIDLARPKENEKNTGFLPEERAWIDEVIGNGYVDVFRHFNQNKKGAYTYWDMKTMARERNVGWRIDYFFVSQNLINKVKRTGILSNVYGSDHCPIEIVL